MRVAQWSYWFLRRVYSFGWFTFLGVGEMEAAEIEIGRAGWHEVPMMDVPGIEPGTRAYQKDLPDGHLTAFVAPPYRKNGWHISVSHRTRIVDAHTNLPMPGRLPTWDEMKDVRYRFAPDNVTMAMLLPPKAQYVNVHPTTLHLWQIADGVGS
jgi:hypothetical protein